MNEDGTYNMEELEGGLTPEEVCLQESCCAGEYRLGEYGIMTNVELFKIQHWLVSMNEAKRYRENTISLLIQSLMTQKYAKTAYNRSLGDLIGHLIRYAMVS